MLSNNPENRNIVFEQSHSGSDGRMAGSGRDVPNYNGGMITAAKMMNNNMSNRDWENELCVILISYSVCGIKSTRDPDLYLIYHEKNADLYCKVKSIIGELFEQDTYNKIESTYFDISKKFMQIKLKAGQNVLGAGQPSMNCGGYKSCVINDIPNSNNNAFLQPDNETELINRVVNARGTKTSAPNLYQVDFNRTPELYYDVKNIIGRIFRQDTYSGKIEVIHFNTSKKLIQIQL